MPRTAAFPQAGDLPVGYQLKPARLAAEWPGGRQFRWRHKVRGYETGQQRRRRISLPGAALD